MYDLGQTWASSGVWSWARSRPALGQLWACSGSMVWARSGPDLGLIRQYSLGQIRAIPGPDQGQTAQGPGRMWPRSGPHGPDVVYHVWARPGFGVARSGPGLGQVMQYGLGQMWQTKSGPDLGLIRARTGADLGQFRNYDLGQTWASCGHIRARSGPVTAVWCTKTLPTQCQTWAKCGKPNMGQTWAQVGPSQGQVWAKSGPVQEV